LPLLNTIERLVLLARLASAFGPIVIINGLESTSATVMPVRKFHSELPKAVTHSQSTDAVRSNN
jgi:hypothetical protein